MTGRSKTIKEVHFNEHDESSSSTKIVDSTRENLGIGIRPTNEADEVTDGVDAANSSYPNGNDDDHRKESSSDKKKRRIRNIINSDSEEEHEREDAITSSTKEDDEGAKRSRQLSDSDSERPTFKRSRIIDSDED